MLALWQKDLCILWKKAKMFLILVVLYLLLSVFNQSFFMAFCLVFAGMLPVTLMAYDEKSKWDRMARVLPLSPGQIVMSRYLFGMLSVLVMTVLYLVTTAAYQLVAGRLHMADQLFSLLMIDAGVFLMQAIYLPLLFRFGVEKGRLSTILSLAAVGAIVGLGNAMVGDAGPTVLTRLFAHPGLTAVLGLAVALAIWALSYLLSVRIYRKQEV